MKVAKLLYGVDPDIPFTILPFFPAYKLGDNRSPTTMEMLRTYMAARDAGLKNVKLGNCHVFAKTEEDWNLLISTVERKAVG